MAVSDDLQQKVLDFANAEAAAFVGALPPPFGPAAVEIGSLFGFAVGGTNFTAADAQRLLDAAVTAIENFLNGIGVSDKEKNAAGAMLWISKQIKDFDVNPAWAADLAELNRTIDHLQAS